MRSKKRQRTIKQLKRGELAYTQPWASGTSACASTEPSGTADTLIKRTLFGFNFVGRPKDPKAWVLPAIAAVYFGLLFGGMAVMFITKSITGDAADPPVGFIMVTGWAVMTIVGLVGMLDAT